MPKYFSSPKHHFSNEHQILCSCATADREPGHTRVGSGNPIVFCRNCGGIFYQSIVDKYLQSEEFIKNDKELLDIKGIDKWTQFNAEEIQERFKQNKPNQKKYYYGMNRDE